MGSFAGQRARRIAQAPLHQRVERRPRGIGVRVVDDGDQHVAPAAVRQHVAGDADHVAQRAGLQVGAPWRRARAAQRAVEPVDRQRAHQLGHHRAGPGLLQQPRQQRGAQAASRATGPSRCRSRMPAGSSPTALDQPVAQHARARPRAWPARRAGAAAPGVRNSCCAITLLLNLLMSRTTSASGGDLQLEARLDVGRRDAVAHAAASLPPISRHSASISRAL